MKITKIEKKDLVYHVTRSPYLIERIFGIKEKVEQFKSLGYDYTFGGGTVYVNKKGKKLGPSTRIGKAIDNWTRKF